MSLLVLHINENMGALYRGIMSLLFLCINENMGELWHYCSCVSMKIWEYYDTSGRCHWCNG